MTRIARIAASFLFIFAFASMPGQILTPVKWSWEAQKTADKEYNLVFTAKIDKGFHVYSQFLKIPDGQNGPIPTSFTFPESAVYTLVGNVKETSKGITKYDPNFELTLKYFENKAVFVQHIKSKNTGIVKGSLEFMCCNDKTCLPPKTIDFEFDLAKAKLATEDKKATIDTAVKPAASAFSDVPLQKAKDSPNPQKIQVVQLNVKNDTVAAKEENKSGLWWLLLKGFGAGLAALLTPCMYPMIPLTVSFFLKKAKKKISAIGSSMIFGLSIIAIFVGITFIATLLFGPNALNQLASSVFFNLFTFAVLLIFGISFLGAFNITLPSSWVNKTDNMSETGGLVGIFFIALTLVIVSFSCTGGIVAGVVASINMGGIYAPVVTMLGFSLGIAIPFTIFSIFPNLMQKMPKSGGWLNMVKVTFGFLELAFALKFLSSADLVNHWGILKREYFIALWIVIFTMLGFYLLGKLRFSHDTPKDHASIFGTMAALFSFAFVVYMVPGLFGAPLNLISGFAPPEYYTEWKHDTGISQNAASIQDTSKTAMNTPHRQKEECPLNLNCYHNYDEALAAAKKQGKPLMIDFTGYSCVNCRKMEADVWSDSKVLPHITNDYILVSLYVDDRKKLPDGKEFYSDILKQKVTTYGDKWSDLEAVRYNFNAQPYYVLLDNNEKKLVETPIGYSSTDDFLQYLEKGETEFQKRSKTTAAN